MGARADTEVAGMVGHGPLSRLGRLLGWLSLMLITSLNQFIMDHKVIIQRRNKQRLTVLKMDFTILKHKLVLAVGGG